MLQLKIKESGRLDRVLRKAELPGAEWLSRSAWDSLFEQGMVRDESGRRLVAGSQQDAGALIQLNLPALAGILPASESLVPVWMADDLALFDKPAGLDSYPLFPWETNSFANRVAAWLMQTGKMSATDFSQLASAPVLEGGLTQRLDRDTSGALLVALTTEKKAAIRTEFSVHHVNKSYLALVHGIPKELEIHLQTWPENQKKMAAGREPKKADAQRVHLSVEILGTGKSTSLLRVRSVYGTRHVVRVSMATMGHPLVGDALYGTSQDGYTAHLLHAQAIQIDGYPKLPEIPPPQSFLDSCRILGIDYFHGNGK